MSQLWSGSHIRRANSVSTPGSHRTLEPRGRASNRRSPPDYAWEEGEQESAEFLSQLPASVSGTDLSFSMQQTFASSFHTIYRGWHLCYWLFFPAWTELAVGKEISQSNSICGWEQGTVQTCESRFCCCQRCPWQQAWKLCHWYCDICLSGRYDTKILVDVVAWMHHAGKWAFLKRPEASKPEKKYTNWSVFHISIQTSYPEDVLGMDTNSNKLSANFHLNILFEGGYLCENLLEWGA